MNLQVLILGTLKRPISGLFALAVTIGFATMFLYLDEFLFFSPYLTLFVPLEKIAGLALDLILSAFSGIVMSLSIFQLKNLPKSKNKRGGAGLAGIVIAIFAGACPCYYLFPLLAIAGGVGGVLGAVGIFFYAYQIPVKLASLVLLALVTFSLERSTRAYCSIAPPPQPES